MSFEEIKQYSQLAVSVGAVVVGWWRMSVKLATWKALNDEKIHALEKAHAETRAKIEAVSPILVLLQTDMASVKTAVEYIKDAVKK